MKKLIITEGQYKLLMESRLLEQTLIEAAKRLESLPEDTGFFVKKQSGIYDSVLYSPSEDKAYGTAEFSKKANGNYSILTIAAPRGYGVFLYELAMMMVSSEGKGLMPDRSGSITPEAASVWNFFYKKRPEVDKAPADGVDYSTKKPKGMSEEVYNSVYRLQKDESYTQVTNNAKKFAAENGTKAVFDAGTTLFQNLYPSKETVYAQYLQKEIPKEEAVQLYDDSYALKADAIKDLDGYYILKREAVKLHDGSYAHEDDDIVDLATGGKALLDFAEKRPDGRYQLKKGAGQMVGA